MSSESVPTVSVLMPVYNTRRYLAEAVDSILAQTYRDFEFIAVDDGSTDGSGDLLRERAAGDARLKVISRPNTGIVGALSDGLAAARGKYIARMDGDDVAKPQRFEKQVRFLDEHPEVVVVGAWVETIDPFGIVFGYDKRPTEHADIDAGLLAGRGGSIVHPAAMIRRDAIDRIGGYRRPYQDSEDLDLWLRLAEIGKVANLPEVLLSYRRHLQSTNFTRHENQMRVKELIVGEAYDRRGLTKPSAWRFGVWHPKPVVEQLRDWAWSALRNGRPDAARKYAIDVWRRAPLSSDSYRLMFCALRGH
jgi:glycosyltransferase involved in cell wall biosynthesis